MNSKMAETSKVKFLSAEEAMGLTSGSKLRSITGLGGVGSRVGPSCTMPPISKSVSVVSPTNSPRCSVQKGNSNPSFRSSGHSKSPRVGNSLIDNPLTRAIRVPEPLNGEQSSVRVPSKTSSSPRLTNTQARGPDIPLTAAAKSKASTSKLSSQENMRSADSEPKYGSNCMSTEGVEKAAGEKAPISSVKDYVYKEASTDSIRPFKKVKMSCPNTENGVNKSTCASSPLIESLPTSTLGGTFCSEAQPKNISVQERFLPKTAKDLSNYPASLATWKGSFEIVDSVSLGEFYDGFLARPPCKVSRKAYEFSKQMPGILQFKLQPRCTVWEEIFDMDSPSGNDIALYFFPGDFLRSQQKYFHLLELIEMQDLALRSWLNGVELLIFTSKQLPVDSQRINLQFYLWGIFRHVKGAEMYPADGLLSPSLLLTSPLNKNHVPLHEYSSVVSTLTMTDDSKVADMEIDMIGVRGVGRADKPVQRPILQEKKVQLELLRQEGEKRAKQEKLRTNSNALDPYENTNQSYKKSHGSTSEGVGSSKCAVGSPHNVVIQIHQGGLTERNLGLRPLAEVKKEYDLDLPPGFPRKIASDAAHKQGNLDTNATQSLLNVRKDGYKDLDISRVLPRQVKIEVTQDLPLQKSFVNALGVHRNLDTPGFSNYSKLTDGKCSSEPPFKVEEALLNVPKPFEKSRNNPDFPPGFRRKGTSEASQISNLDVEKEKAVLINGKIPSPLKKEKAVESPSRAFQVSYLQPHKAKQTSEPKEVPLKFDQVPAFGMAMEPTTPLTPCSDHENQKYSDLRLIQTEKPRDPSKKSKVKDDSNVTGNEILREMKQEKKEDLSSTRDDCSDSPTPPGGDSGCLQLFPMEVESNLPELESAKNKRPEERYSSELSLSRPQYIKDGQRWITAITKERLQEDECAKDLQLML